MNNGNLVARVGVALSILSFVSCASEEAPFEEEVGRATQSVINGTEVTPNSAPWMVALSGLSPSPGGHRCGGSLIDPRYVLTAAHCVIERGYVAPPSTLKAVLGAHDISTMLTDPNAQVIDAEYVSVHPRFGDPAYSHDIALIRLAQPAVLNSRVRTIDLANYGDGPGTSVLLTGWGKTSSTSDKSLVLRSATFPIVPNSTCDAVLDNDLDNTMLCAGYVPEDASQRLTACHGDSGGPLVTYRGNNRWEQVGVVSWGQADVCGTYSAYSRVTSQLDFIRWVQASGYRYLRCANTGWALSDSNRLVPAGTNGFELDYDVATLEDSCVISHSNELNGWGTLNGDFKIVMAGNQLNVPAQAKVTWEGNYSTHFSVKYPTTGRYRIRFGTPLTVTMQHSFEIVKISD